MAAVKLYGPVHSTNVCRAVLALEESGVEYEVVPLNFFAGEQRNPEHLARNPFGQIPAFQDGDLILFESRAISRYVLRKYNFTGHDLLRRGSLEEAALVDVWTEVEAHQYSPAINPVVYQCLIIPHKGGVCDQSVVDESLRKLRGVLEVYEKRLSEKKYLAGDFVSFADLSHFPYTFCFMHTPHAAVFDGYPRVKAWWEDITARPSVKKMADAMSIIFAGKK